MTTETATEIPWDIFCDGYNSEPWIKRFDLRKPFIRDGYQYATDARIAIRAPAAGVESTIYGVTPQTIAEMNWDHADKRDYQPWPARWPAVPGRTVTCCRCDGRGRFKCMGECRICKGRGWHDGGECKKCNCEGVYFSEPCDYCGGNGSGELLLKQPIGAADISGDYDDRIRRLPGPIEVSLPTDDKLPVYFRFAGGEGLVQPLASIVF